MAKLLELSPHFHLGFHLVVFVLNSRARVPVQPHMGKLLPVVISLIGYQVTTENAKL